MKTLYLQIRKLRLNKICFLTQVSLLLKLRNVFSYYEYFNIYLNTIDKKSETNI